MFYLRMNELQHEHSEINFAEEVGRPWVEVTGPNKDHVGEAYACLSELLLGFAPLTVKASENQDNVSGAVYVKYPAFNRTNGNVMFYETRELTKYWD
jgi:hypothetical protein